MAEYIVDTTDGILDARTTGEVIRCRDCADCIYFAFSSKAFPVDMNSLMVDGKEIHSWPHDALGGEAIRDLGYEPVEDER